MKPGRRGFFKLIVLSALLALPVAAYTVDLPGAGAIPGSGSIPNPASGATVPGAPANPTAAGTGGTATGASGSGLNAMDPAVAALQKTCGVSVTKKSGELQVFSVGVKCFENIVNGLAESTITKMSAKLSNIVYILLVLWLTVYGAKVALGMSSGEQAKKDFMIHSLKIAFVAWLVFSLGLIDIFQLVMSSYQSLISIVLANAQLGDCSKGGGLFSTGGTEAVWTTIDCMLTKFVGWEAKAGGGSNLANVPYFFGIMFAKMAPANGFLIGGILFSALWSLLSGFFRMAFIYMLSLIALILLFAIAPLIVPMILFKRTYTYFDGWVKLIVSMALQPVILFAFFSFIATLMSKTITDMQKLLEEVKLAYGSSNVTVTGNTRTNEQQIAVISDTLGKLDPRLLLDGITTLVIAYLLISFINFVSQLALELAGVGSAPNLGEKSGNMFSFGG